MSKTWFITGASRGFGRRFAEAALQRGDRVAATARDSAALTDLSSQYGEAVLPLTLDVTDRAGVKRAVNHAHDHFGRLDVIVNNAGSGLMGVVEDLTEDALRAQFEVNVFAPLWVTQAALPHLRSQGSGHIVMLSSLLGVAAFPTTGGYSASKAALEAYSESLAQEVSGFGVKVTIVEPGAFNTGFSANATYSTPSPDYAQVHETVGAAFATFPSPDPAGVGAALLDVVDAEDAPLRVFFGTFGLQTVEPLYAQRLATWKSAAAISAKAETVPA
ncbi:SDR family NAD(P)-dependent oxidoreductase [Kineococcus aurantiacus]|uniref:NAD(P)-dependent dehydrogenase (Short-subunit alcohol dehydrogenase family) n=1 Tax=Kineococcus aurantiacus TaxID=37633 RepID=A0A7Y9J0V7_9ACTN|nr:SDR family NAD(P)-dependent oxidoreductase [Kineococcus aurantiacus]NYD22597.1 NAD(P)-dependent dehydrogenase (short-subunit alcohol dehydrogenase family) [Kineococcus aurantiacus]